MSVAFLSLGSSMGNKQAILESAIENLKNLGETLKISSFYETEPWGGVAKNTFLNAAVKLKTELSPLDLLHACQKIETKHGRTRNEKWEDRTLDIDIISYDDLVINTPELKIPHPLAKERDFVMIPMREIL